MEEATIALINPRQGTISEMEIYRQLMFGHLFAEDGSMCIKKPRYYCCEGVLVSDQQSLEN